MIFSCYRPFSLFAIASVSIGGDRITDGHASGPVFVMETRVGRGRPRNPTYIVLCTAQMHSNFVSSELYPYKGLCDKFLFPTLTITIIGIPSCSGLIVNSFIVTHSLRRGIKSKIFTTPARAPCALLGLRRTIPPKRPSDTRSLLELPFFEILVREPGTRAITQFCGHLPDQRVGS